MTSAARRERLHPNNHVCKMAAKTQRDASDVIGQVANQPAAKMAARMRVERRTENERSPHRWSKPEVQASSFE
jgi:hypothetical protein